MNYLLFFSLWSTKILICWMCDLTFFFSSLFYECMEILVNGLTYGTNRHDHCCNFLLLIPLVISLIRTLIAIY